ncbi:MAG: (deoxy)nucleoside triphosphate pyrophosphohydrolase [Deltaproteobacteria bacterium]|nr:(deoxy)nucleoside triphosphate pyrophosphohydrolase [Deltaproteobacteria bacterium]
MPGKKTIRVVAAVIEREGRYLITQRRASGVLPDLWEFCGGKVEPGESDPAALRREILERLGVQVKVGNLLSFVRHPYEHYEVELYLYECALLDENLQKLRIADWRWVSSAEFPEYTFTPADQASMDKLLGITPEK